MQSVLALGSVVGLLVVNYVSDHWGKKKSILLIEGVAAVGFAGRKRVIQVSSALCRYGANNTVTLIGAEYKIVGLVLVGQAFCGFSSFSMVLSTYIYPS